jgi:hypothetical protein
MTVKGEIERLPLPRFFRTSRRTLDYGASVFKI